METLDDLFRRLDRLNEIGASLSNECDLNLLLERIVLAAKQITRADGGTLYLVSEDRHYLHFEIVRTDSLDIAFGGSSAQLTSGKFPDLPLYAADGAPNLGMVAAYAAITGRARAQKCCSVADPMRDLRIANAITSDAATSAGRPEVQ
jgi:GAF domain-containing protein